MKKSQLRSITAVVVSVLLLSGAMWTQEAVLEATAPAKIADLKPTVILVSIDGCRWDFPDKYESPTLHDLIKSGVRAEMIPSFPTKTFPNHYTLVTGLYPGHHGIVANNMWDDEMKAGFKMDDRAAVTNAKWWGGEPIWVTAHRQGQKSAAMFWPGSEAPIEGMYPDYWQKYDDKMEYSKRVQWVLAQLDRPVSDRPTFSTLYFSAVDTAGHDFGPDADETRKAMAKVDTAIGELTAGLKARGIYDRVDLIVVADHGMTPVSKDRQVFLEDYANIEKMQVVDWSPVLAVRARNGDNESLYKKLKHVPHVKVYRKLGLPQRYHYRTNPRVMPIIGVADLGWGITTRKRLANLKKEERGTHGYDPALRDMHAIFIAHGPNFVAGVTLKPFENVNVYPAMAKILGVTPAKNDGDVKVLEKAMVKGKSASSAK